MVQNSKRLALFSIYLSVLGSGLQFSTVVPFSSYMVTKLGGVNNRSDTGLWAGILAGSILIGQSLSSPMFGILSDRWGRKPVLLIGTMLGAIFSFAFGLSFNLWMAIALRFLQGVFSSVCGVSKTLLSELCPGREQANAMSWFSLISVMNIVLGIMIGGLLYDPSFLHSEFFSNYPFLLPNLFPSVCCFVSFLGASMFLKETLKKESAMSEEEERRTLRQIIKERNVYVILISFSMISFIDTTSIEIFTLWCYANKKDGGFELDPFDIGLILSVSFALFAPFQKLYYDFLAKRFTLINIGRAHILMRMVVFSLCPLASFVRYQDIPSKIVLVICKTLMQSTGFPTLTSIYILTNNSVIQEERGRVNGVSMTVGSAARGVGPFLFGYIFAQTAQDGLFFPLNYAFSFECIALFHLAFYFLLNSLPESLNYPREEKASTLLSYRTK